MSGGRKNIVKIRLSETELEQLDAKRLTAGFASRAEYLRYAALTSGVETFEIAQLIGRAGLILNSLDDATPQSLQRVDAIFKEIASTLVKAVET